MWYLHSHVVCARLFLSILDIPPLLMMRSANLHHLNIGGFFLKLKLTPSTGRAGGLFGFVLFRSQNHTKVYSKKRRAFFDSALRKHFTSLSYLA